jgi:hypothetical protein
MGQIYLTPKDEGAAVELSNTLFRKKILPKGSIDYKGRKITFDDAYLTDLAASYKTGAYDQVPFMLADKDNRHTMDPDRFRGEVKGVEVASDGLYATMELSADAAELVRKNPKLGVSARIVEGYDRADGKSFPRAMQHVLGTLDPRIPGLGAWTEVSLSGYDSGDEVVDLTNAAYEGASDVAKTDDTDQTIDGLSREEYEALLASLDLTDDVTDEGDDGEGDGVNAADREPVTASLSNEDRRSIDLANEQIAELKREKAHDKFEADKREWVRQGVPPALVELARPVLEAPDGFVIDLSNGVDGDSKVDAVHIMRQFLDSAVGYLDLAKERGHAADFANEATDGTNDPDAELLKLWAQMDGEAV